MDCLRAKPASSLRMVIQSQDSSSTAKDTENAESRRPGVNFINLLPSALKCQDSKSAKKQSRHQSFWAFRSTGIKAAHYHVVEIAYRFQFNQHFMLDFFSNIFAKKITKPKCN